MTENEYRGMRNPYHMFHLWEIKEQMGQPEGTQIVLTPWNGISKANKKAKLTTEFKKKYKKSGTEVDMDVFDPNGVFDTKTNAWKTYPSPLFPWIEQWWDEI